MVKSSVKSAESGRKRSNPHETCPEVGGVTYAGTFIDKDGHTVMVAMLDGTGMNALYFQEIIEG